MKHKSYVLVLLASVFISSEFISSGFNIGVPKAHAQAQNTQRLEQRCENVSERIANRKTGIEKSITSLNNSSAKVDSVITKRIATLTEKGVDTQQLSANLAEYKTRVQNMVSIRQETLNQLNALNPSDCVSNKTQFAESLKAINSGIKQRNAENRELKTFLRENLIDLVKSLNNSDQ